MKLADYIIDVGPDGGTKGGKIVFKGTPKEMVEHGNTITAEYLKKATFIIASEVYEQTDK